MLLYSTYLKLYNTVMSMLGISQNLTATRIAHSVRPPDIRPRNLIICVPLSDFLTEDESRTVRPSWHLTVALIGLDLQICTRFRPAVTHTAHNSPNGARKMPWKSPS